MPGTSRRRRAMAPPGIVLSQPTSTTMASNMWPRPTSSIESAMTSRLTRDVFMPSVPIVMPSLMAIVLNSIGVPPASRTPRFTCSASPRRLKLHGIVSVQVLAMPMMGRAMSSSVKPMALRYEQSRAIRGKGVDEIVCLSVNDAFVMGAWGKANDAAGKVRMLADGNGEFTRAVGLALDASGFGMGSRSQRYAMVVKDGKVEHLAVEPGPGLNVSSAESILAKL